MPKKRGKYVGVRLTDALYKYLPKQGKSKAIRDILSQYYSKELLSKDDIKTLEQENTSLNKQTEELNKRLTGLNIQVEELRKDKLFLMKQVEDQKILYLPFWKRVKFWGKKQG